MPRGAVSSAVSGREPILERPGVVPAGLRVMRAELTPQLVLSAVVAFLFAATGPVAIILAVGQGGGLSQADLTSWIFGIFTFGGLITILFSVLYRQPLAFAWTIPGTVLLAPAFSHLTFPQMIGAFVATGLLMAALGLSGLVRRGMAAVPMPI